MNLLCKNILATAVVLISLQARCMEKSYTVSELSHALANEAIEAELKLSQKRHKEKIWAAKSLGETQVEPQIIAQALSRLIQQEKELLDEDLQSLEILLANDDVGDRDVRAFFVATVNRFYYRDLSSTQKKLRQRRKKYSKKECDSAFLSFSNRFWDELNPEALLICLVLHKDFIDFLPKAVKRTSISL